MIILSFYRRLPPFLSFEGNSKVLSVLITSSPSLLGLITKMESATVPSAFKMLLLSFLLHPRITTANIVDYYVSRITTANMIDIKDNNRGVTYREQSLKLKIYIKYDNLGSLIPQISKFFFLFCFITYLLLIVCLKT